MTDERITPRTRPIRRGDVWIRRDGVETAVHDTRTGVLHVLNSSALAIWDLCDGQTTIDEMAEAIAELTGLDGSRARLDVITAVTELAERNLVAIE